MGGGKGVVGDRSESHKETQSGLWWAMGSWQWNRACGAAKQQSGCKGVNGALCNSAAVRSLEISTLCAQRWLATRLA